MVLDRPGVVAPAGVWAGPLDDEGGDSGVAATRPRPTTAASAGLTSPALLGVWGDGISNPGGIPPGNPSNCGYSKWCGNSPPGPKAPMNGRAGRPGCCPFATVGGVCELPPLDGVDDSADMDPGLGATESGVDSESRDLRRFILSIALLRLPVLLLIPAAELDVAEVSSLILLAGDG